MSGRMCTCSMHCPLSPYHERACCERTTCDCWCHKRPKAKPPVHLAEDELREPRERPVSRQTGFEE